MQDYIDFIINDDGSLSFQRPIDRVDDGLLNVLKDIIGDDIEFCQLEKFIKDGEKIKRIIGDYPLCG